MEVTAATKMGGVVEGAIDLSVRMPTLEESGLVTDEKKGRGLYVEAAGPQQTVTKEQEVELVLVAQRDKYFDEQIGVLGEGVDELRELAQRQGELAREQNAMLDDVEQQVGVNQYTLTGLNMRMKGALVSLEKRKSLIYVDCLCLLIMAGLIVTIIVLVQEDKKKND